MDEVFENEMAHEFEALLDCGLFRRLGSSRDFDFRGELKVLRSWNWVANKDAAIFSLGSKSWERAYVDMMNDVNQGVCSYQDMLRVQEVMRHFKKKKRPELDNKWLEFCARSNVDKEILDGVHLSATFMSYCRETYIERLEDGHEDRSRIYFLFFAWAFCRVVGMGGLFPKAIFFYFRQPSSRAACTRSRRCEQECFSYRKHSSDQ